MAQIKIVKWNGCPKGYFKGFATVELPSGMVLHDLGLFEKTVNGVVTRWINTPTREWTDNAGLTQYSPLLTFTDSATRDRFRDAVLPPLMEYIERRKEAHNALSERMRKANNST